VGAVRSRGRQVDAGHRAQERVGQLNQDAGAVTAGRLGAGGAAVLEVGQRGQGIADDRVTAAAQDVGHHGDAARVVLAGRVVQPGRAGKRRERHDSGHRGTSGRPFMLVQDGTAVARLCPATVTAAKHRGTLLASVTTAD
jgi:hypothetical protein